MNETRVNLRHLLEDLRDSYPHPIEEAILTELVANALDSRASMIRFQIDKDHREILCIDDGEGMTRKQPGARLHHVGQRSEGHHNDGV